MLNSKQILAKYWQGIAIAIYLVLVTVGFYLLATSQTGASITTPWQTIRHSYIYVFWLATLLLGMILWFAKFKPSSILLLLVLHSILLHSYLPLTHTLLYGADQWRHSAVESRIIQGLPIVETTLSDGTTGSTLGNVLGTISYSSLWYISAAKTVLIQAVSHWDTATTLIFVNKWLQVLWWSLTVPLLLYFLGRALQWREKQSLLLVWLGYLPFAFQYAGAVTIPVSFGFPLFLLGIVLLLHRLQSSDKRFIKWLLLVGIASAFGYLLYAVLFWVGWGMCEIVRRLKTEDLRLKNVKTTLLLLIAILILPSLELAGRYTSLQSSVFSLQTLKTIFTNFTLFDLARGPGSIDYLNGNIIFNQVPASSFVANLFTAWRGWIPVFIVSFWCVSVCGIKKLWNSLAGKWFVLFGVGLFVNYIVSRYFLSGEQILTRRLDTTLALFFIVYFTAGVFAVFENTRLPTYTPVIAILILSFAITASYSLGPDTITVSSGEYAAAKQVWSSWQLKQTAYSHPCVVANQSTLLALEALSSKQIVGGGFPINGLFAQPELVGIYRQMRTGLSESLWEQALADTGANGCWFVSTNNLGYNVVVNYER